MIVTGIEIVHHEQREASRTQVANVYMTLKDRVVTLLCQLDLPEGESPASRARAFVGDATRQLRRMPEFRSGRDTLEFADGLDYALPTLA